MGSLLSALWSQWSWYKHAGREVNTHAIATYYTRIICKLSVCILSYNSFHNKLKNHPRYLDHKLNRRLDDLIHILLKYECDMFMAQQAKQVRYMHTCQSFSHISAWILLFKIMKSPRDASMKLEGDRHQNGLKIDSTDVQVYAHCTMCRINTILQHAILYLLRNKKDSI